MEALFPRFPVDAVLVVDAHNGDEQWTGEEWNAYADRCEANRSQFIVRLTEVVSAGTLDQPQSPGAKHRAARTGGAPAIEGDGTMSGTQAIPLKRRLLPDRLRFVAERIRQGKMSEAAVAITLDALAEEMTQQPDLPPRTCTCEPGQLDLTGHHHEACPALDDR